MEEAVSLVGCQWLSAPLTSRLSPPPPPLQGSAADLIKLAMCNIRQRFQEELPPLVPADGQGASAVWEVSNLPAQAQVPARLVLQIHDELVFEVGPYPLPPLLLVVFACTFAELPMVWVAPACPIVSV